MCGCGCISICNMAKSMHVCSWFPVTCPADTASALLHVCQDAGGPGEVASTADMNGCGEGASNGLADTASWLRRQGREAPGDRLRTSAPPPSLAQAGPAPPRDSHQCLPHESLRRLMPDRESCGGIETPPGDRRESIPAGPLHSK